MKLCHSFLNRVVVHSPLFVLWCFVYRTHSIFYDPVWCPAVSLDPGPLLYFQKNFYFCHFIRSQNTLHVSMLCVLLLCAHCTYHSFKSSAFDIAVCGAHHQFYYCNTFHFTSLICNSWIIKIFTWFVTEHRIFLYLFWEGIVKVLHQVNSVLVNARRNVAMCVLRV